MHKCADVMLLKRETIGVSFPATSAKVGDTVNMLGLAPDTLEPAFINGIVSAVKLNELTIVAHGSHAWSGGAVVNVHGKVVGVIVSDTAEALQRVTAVRAEILDNVARSAGYPPFQV